MRLSSRLKIVRLLFLLIALGAATSLSAQNKKTVPTTPDTPRVVPPVVPPAPKTGPKPYKDVITAKAITRKGLFSIHQVEDKWFLELRDSLLGRDMLIVNRIARAPVNTRAGSFGYAGDEINQNVIRFEKGPSNKLFLRTISYSVYTGDSARPMYKSVMNSNLQPITAAFDIKAFSKDSTGTVIDLTDFLTGDNEVMFFASSYKTALRLGSLQNDKSYILDIRPYPINTEIRTVKTYSRTSGALPVPGAPAPPGGGYATFELNTSIIILPAVAMAPRYYDERVAYFTTEYTDFDANPQGVKDISIITRWRLEVKPEDMDKFKKGELVEPKKPIVFYIDPSTPEKWVKYLIQGVNDWQKPFEKAGFKNAIYAKRAPSKAEDSTWTLEDARYSAIVYKPSNIPNASGPHVHDPRSGEILESHINWYHNIMRLLHDWYLIQAGPSDPLARKPKFDDELMGQLIRFASSHEIGHTLGLPHNMGASSATPVEKLRDKKWVEANGHTPSIMDYARFNYVAQPEDSIGMKGLFPRIGEYDDWAIEWGYRPIFGKSDTEQKEILNELVKAKAGNPRLRYLDSDGLDPRAQTEDLGDNAMKASFYGLKNLKRIIPLFPEWINEKGQDYTDLEKIYGEILTQYGRYIGHVVVNIGGIQKDNKTSDQAGPVYTIVPRAKQKEALSFVLKNVFDTPYWLLDKKILDLVSAPSSDRISSIQDNFLGSLLSTGRLQRLISSANRQPNSYLLEEYMDDLKSGIWKELPAHTPIDNYRRNIQKSYIERLGSIVNPASGGGSAGGGIVIFFGPVSDPKKSDIVSVAKETLRSLKSAISNALPGYTDKMSRYHLQDVLERIGKISSKDR